MCMQALFCRQGPSKVMEAYPTLLRLKEGFLEVQDLWSSAETHIEQRPTPKRHVDTLFCTTN